MMLMDLDLLRLLLSIVPLCQSRGRVVVLQEPTQLESIKVKMIRAI